MPDPNTDFSERRSDPDGVGPYEFTVPELAPGESWRLDLRERENGRFVGLSPAGYDALLVDNTSATVPLTVRLNDSQEFPVPANTSRPLTSSGTYVVEVENTSATDTLDAGAVEVAIQKEPYGADEAARNRRGRGVVSQVVENFTGVTPRW